MAVTSLPTLTTYPISSEKTHFRTKVNQHKLGLMSQFLLLIMRMIIAFKTMMIIIRHTRPPFLVVLVGGARRRTSNIILENHRLLSKEKFFGVFG